MQSTCSLLCVRNWSLLGYIKDLDIKAVMMMQDIDEDEEFEDEWDKILL